jgi:3'(2'), 5'-bisphosphate nucleotidase
MTELLKTALQAALDAGEAILRIYDRDFSVDYKDDRSPLTEADTAAHELICAALEPSGLPVLSEESRTVPYEIRRDWRRFWLVDPLDGTKEFIKKNGEFTVNIALIENGRPVLGVVYAPVLQTVYCGRWEVEGGMSKAWKAAGCSDKSVDDVIESAVPLPTSYSPHFTAQRALRVVASRSHCNEETEKFIEALEGTLGAVELVSSGSSLKLCLVAEGRAEVYPRIAPTMEWDTAAAQAVVEAAGGRVVQYDPAVPAAEYLRGRLDVESRMAHFTSHISPLTKPLLYNKPDLLNPSFVVTGAARTGSEKA